MNLRNKIKNSILVLSFLGYFGCLQNKALADYSYDTSSEIQVTETTDSSFELTYSEDELSCAAGGGSTPSMWIGTMTGNGNTDANDYDGTDKSDDFLTAGLGFNIPLGAKSNYNNCDKVLAIVETEKFLKMIGSLQDLGVVEEDKIKILLNQYLSKNQSKLGIDFVSTLSLTDIED